MIKKLLLFCLLIAFTWQTTTLSANGSFPSEIIYIQTDKQTYFTDENIWFRAFLLHAETFELIANSQYVYAEIINQQGEVKNRIMIRQQNGVFAGYIPVHENLEAGTYTLRFYTRHVEQFGEEFFFTRTIQIITPQSLQESTPHTPYPIPHTPNDFALTFHPEGGDIPAGVYTRIAFKAINSTGLGEDVHGEIVNNNGNRVTTFESTHLGMGYFHIVANGEEQLTAIVRNNHGIEQRVPLPRARENIVSLQITQEDGFVVVRLPNVQQRVVYLSIQHRGEELHAERWNNNRTELVIPEDNLPTGVIGFILSDDRGIPMSERQIFNVSRFDVVNTTFSTEQESYSVRERVNASVLVTDDDGSPLLANFSISVINHDMVSYDASINILSHLLLSSDLRGHIEDPAFYFSSENKNRKEKLDLVMLTHGWTRFDTRIVSQENVERRHFETSLSLSGYLEGSLVRRRSNQPVTLLSLDLPLVYTTITDDQGRFTFRNIDFPEGTEFIVQGSTGTTVRVNEQSFPRVSTMFLPRIQPPSISNDQLQNDFHRQLLDDGIWALELDEFIVTGRREPVNLRIHPLSNPLNTRLTREDLGGWRYTSTSMFQLIRNTVPGLLTTEEGELIFERKLMNFLILQDENPPPPLIFLDRTEINSEILESLPADIVESIEYISNRPASEFGMRAYGGVIMITTTGEPTQLTRFPNVTVVRPLGHQITREFFSPAYTTQNQRLNPRADLRTTIYWNPSVTTEADGRATLSFYTSDHVGNYVVIIEGITYDGRLVHSMSRIK